MLHEHEKIKHENKLVFIFFMILILLAMAMTSNAQRLVVNPDGSAKVETTYKTFNTAIKHFISTEVKSRTNSSFIIDNNNKFLYTIKYDNRIYKVYYKINDEEEKLLSQSTRVADIRLALIDFISNE